MRRWLFLALAWGAGCRPPAPELHVLTWPDYFAPGTIAGFERENGCRVVLDYIESSESLQAKLEGGRSGYDVVFPSDEVVPLLAAGGMLERLDRARLPNLRNLDPRFLGLPCDPGNEHAVPYMWGTTGIAYLKDRIDPAPDSWAALWDPRYVPRLSMLDDAREAFAAAMRAVGADPRAVPGPDEIARAKAKLLERKPRAYDSSPRALLVNGDCWIAQCYSGDALQASEELGGRVGYVIPREGGTLWVDHLAVARGAQHFELAHRFIDYLLRPEVAAAITNATRFPNPNASARRFVRREVLEDPRVYPPDEVWRRCAPLPALPPDIRKVLHAAWAEVKAR